MGGTQRDVDVIDDRWRCGVVTVGVWEKKKEQVEVVVMYGVRRKHETPVLVF